MKSLKLTPATLLNIGLILFIIILFFWKPCNKPDEHVNQLRAENAALKKEKAAADDSITVIRKRYQDAASDARGREQLALQEKQEADSKVKQQQRTIDRLTGIIRHSNDISGISGFRDSANKVLVSKEYKAACDSLPVEIDKLNASLIEKDSAIDIWSGVLAYEIQLRDSALEAEQQHSAIIDRLFQRQKNIADSALKIAKPRGAFLLGVGIMGNEEKFLSGASLKAAYLTKSGKMLQYSPGVVQFPGMPKAKVYHEVSAFFKPFR